MTLNSSISVSPATLPSTISSCFTKPSSIEERAENIVEPALTDTLKEFESSLNSVLPLSFSIMLETSFITSKSESIALLNAGFTVPLYSASSPLSVEAVDFNEFTISETSFLLAPDSMAEVIFLSSCVKLLFASLRVAINASKPFTGVSRESLIDSNVPMKSVSF